MPRFLYTSATVYVICWGWRRETEYTCKLTCSLSMQELGIDEFCLTDKLSRNLCEYFIRHWQDSTVQSYYTANVTGHARPRKCGRYFATQLVAKHAMHTCSARTPFLGVVFCELDRHIISFIWIMYFFLLSIFCLTSSTFSQDAERVLLTDAVKEGAVCLDGTAPGYYFKQGGAAISCKIFLFCFLFS